MKLELDGLTKEFGDFTAVNHINLTMTNGVYGLLGVNGAGKTTLMRMLCTLLKPTSGTICCNGKDIFSMDSEYRKLLALQICRERSCVGNILSRNLFGRIYRYTRLVWRLNVWNGFTVLIVITRHE